MLTTSTNQFLYNGQPFRILSGAMHYFRVPPQYWRDRMEKMRLFGLNTLETYVAWNLHEPRPGEFHFDGALDLARYIQTAGEVGLKVIVRPGPYICSEWDFGGLPAWLLKDPHMQVRCAYPPYLEAVDRFFDALLPHIVPLQDTRGGPIMAVQVENEYGSYAADKTYLTHLADGLCRRGVDVLLFTSDGPRDGTLQSGTLPGMLSTVNFAFEAPAAFEKLRTYQPDGPLMVTEFWSGWFDHWGEAHHISADESPSIQRSVQTLEDILSAGSSVSFYMFHGGTNFGFMNGANLELSGYQADVTSYDYAAPLDEAGDPAPRFAAFREVLGKYVDLPPLPSIPPVTKRAYGTVRLSGCASLFESLDSLSQKHTSLAPEPMEYYDQDYGLILYRTHISGPRPEAQLLVHEVRDRAQVFLNGRPVGLLDRETRQEMLPLAIPPGGAVLDILVENQGRVNFGPGLMDRKGIVGWVALDGQLQMDWEVYPLPMEDLSGLSFQPVSGDAPLPAFFQGTFEVDEPADTFLALPGWSKGVAWINGFNLGRYWKRGPQHTLYVPGPCLQKGRNTLLVLELDGVEQPQVELRDQADLG